MSKVILYSALFGDYDFIRPVPDCGVEQVMFTDQPHPESCGWNVITDPLILKRVEQYPHPRLRAKYFKLHPFEFFQDYDISIWLDASWIVQSPSFVKEIVALLENVDRLQYSPRHNGASPIAFFPHRWRTNVRDELQEHLKIQKYMGLPIVQQVKSYLQEGFPDNIGLMECTCIPCHHNDERVKTFYRAWWDENVKWSYADQLSVGYCAWKTGLPFAFLPMNLAQQRWFALAAWRGDR